LTHLPSASELRSIIIAYTVNIRENVKQDHNRVIISEYKQLRTEIMMLILWYADFDGTEETLEKGGSLLKEVVKTINASVDGPYFPQNEALLYIFKIKTFEQFNQAGRTFLTRVYEEGINITPVRYEVAITPEEFWGT
jgi:hypothetical protein